ncbi:MAG: hypothetical protein KF729_26625 [Sandaracinaceae bacterium]|nr:hypothetical protein [Sandaracinaceae bacterium]
MSTVVNWNGVELPDELRGVPKGRYLLVPVDDVPALTSEQEAGLEVALASVRGGGGVSRAEARERVDAALRR